MILRTAFNRDRGTMVHAIVLLKILLNGGGFKVKGSSNRFQTRVKALVDECLNDSTSEEWSSKYSEIAGIVLQDEPHWGRLLVLVVATKCFGESTGLSNDCLISWLTAALYKLNAVECEIPDKCLERVWSGDRYWWLIILHCLIILYMVI